MNVFARSANAGVSCASPSRHPPIFRAVAAQLLPGRAVDAAVQAGAAKLCVQGVRERVNAVTTTTPPAAAAPPPPAPAPAATRRPTRLALAPLTIASMLSVVMSPFHSETLSLMCGLLMFIGSLALGRFPARERAGERERESE